LKKLIIILLILFTSNFVFADEETRETTSRVPGSGNLANHRHYYTDKYYPDTNTWRPARNALIYGPGADIVVFESEHPFCESLEVQTRYDCGNNETTVYGVVKVNLWKFFNNDKR
jgi:hypothetical protein